MRAAPPLAGEPPILPRSLWADIAIAAPPTVPLSGAVRADVAVVGAGYTGLAAASRLAEAGLRVAVVDAAEPGWGASGRNNGQVIPGLKFDPDELVAKLGVERGERLVAWGGDAPSTVFDLIARYRIDCSAVRNGWIQPAYTRRAAAAIASRCDQWARRGVAARPIARADLPAVLGTSAYVSAWLDPRGGTIDPLSYSRGLAAAAIGCGASLYTHSPAQSLERNGAGWVLRTPDGRIEAPRVLVATGGYADDMVAGLRRAMLPVRTAQVATAPLTERQLQAILPGRQGASDTRRLLTSFRITPDGRLGMGGAWATASLREDHLMPHLHRVADELFGHLGPVRWAYGWSGFFAVTGSHLPRLHESADGIFCAWGCNGRGIGVSTAMGLLCAERLLGAAPETLALPFGPLKRERFYRFRQLGVAVATVAKGLQDRADRRQTRFAR